MPPKVQKVDEFDDFNEAIDWAKFLDHSGNQIIGVIFEENKYKVISEAYEDECAI